MSGTYDCASYGGTCDDCLDPATSDFSEGGACYEAPATGAPVAIQACTDSYRHYSICRHQTAFLLFLKYIRPLYMFGNLFL